MNLWLPGAEHISGRHSGGGDMLRDGGHYCTHHITVTGKGSYTGTKGALLGEGYEPTLLLDPTANKRGQFLAADRSGFALEHTTFETNREGTIHVQIEWVWPSMSEDITKAPYFDKIWNDLIPWLEQLGIPSEWTFGVHSTSRDEAHWKKSGHRGHINAPGNSHVDNLPTKVAPAWHNHKTKQPVHRAVKNSFIRGTRWPW